MKRLFGLVIFVLLILVVIGFARGWFLFTSTRQDGANQVDLNLSVDSGKMRDDANAARREASELTEETADNLRGIGNSIDRAQTDDVPDSDVPLENERTLPATDVRP